MMKTVPLPPTRRAVLRAAGVALAVPLSATRRADAAPGQRRFVVFHVPEGVPVGDGSFFASTGDRWWPNADLSAFPRATAPLARHRSRLLFVKGISFGAGDRHIQGMEEVLTGNLGGPSRTVGGITVAGGMSIDQILGQHLGKGALYKSYGLGVLNHLEGVTGKRRISYSGPGSGRDPINDPLKTFDDLLANAGDLGAAALEARRRQLAAKKSVMDSLRGELTSLRCELGVDGRRKLDAYLAGVREIETRLAQQLAAPAAPASPSTLARPTREGDRAFWGARQNAPAIGDLQMRTAVNALAADVTRVVVFQWNQSVNRQNYPWLPVSDKNAEGHFFAHASALKPAEAARWTADREIIYGWYSAQLARFLDMLAEVRDGEGTLLDSTMVLYCSEMSHGHHGGAPLPYLLAGSAGRRFAQGRMLDIRQASAGKNRMVNDLLTGILHGYGLPLGQIGKPESNGQPCTEILS